MNDQVLIDPRDEFVNVGAIYRMARDGLNLGYEWTARGPDEIDERVHTYLDRLTYSEQYKGPLNILDLGCAHGTRIARFAQTGLTCVGVDLLDQSASFEQHNKTLQQQGKPALTFIQSDIRKLNVADYTDQQFVAVNCSLAMHFMERDDILHMLDFIKQISTPQTLVTISLNTSEETPRSDLHYQTFKILWEERKRYMDVMGYKPSPDFKYRLYAPTDMRIAMKMAGLVVHDDISKEIGVTALVGSTHYNPLFAPRAEMKLPQRVKRYLGFNNA